MNEKAKNKRLPSGDIYYGMKAEAYVSRREKNEQWQNEMAAMRRMLDMFPQGIRVLDVPFGTGRFVPYYLERNMEVWGLDASPEMISAAQLELGEDFKKCNIKIGDARNLPYKDEMFDLVVCFRFFVDIICIKHVRECLCEMRRVTRGHIIVDGDFRKDSEPRDRAPYEWERMSHNLYRSEIEGIIEGCGVEIDHVEGPFKKERSRYAFLCKKEEL